MADVNYIFLLSLTIIVIGYIVKKLKIITEENGKVIAKIIFNITLPALILKITSAIEFKLALVLLPIVNIIFGFIMLIIGLIISRNYPREKKGIILMTLIGFNVANFSFPLIEGVFGEAGLQNMALIDAGNAFTIFVLCYLVGSIYSPSVDANDVKIDLKFVAMRLLKSAPLMSYVVAIIINFSDLVIPIFISDLLDILSRANSALTLLLLGIYLNFKFEKSQWGIILKVLIARYSVGLVIGLLLFFLLPFEQFDHLFRMIVLISLVLPVGLAVIPFSVEFEYDQKIISMIANLTIIISFALMWALILLLNG